MTSEASRIGGSIDGVRNGVRLVAKVFYIKVPEQAVNVIQECTL